MDNFFSGPIKIYSIWFPDRQRFLPSGRLSGNTLQEARIFTKTSVAKSWITRYVKESSRNYPSLSISDIPVLVEITGQVTGVIPQYDRVQESLRKSELEKISAEARKRQSELDYARRKFEQAQAEYEKAQAKLRF